MEAKISCTASQLDALYLWRNPSFFEMSTEELAERLIGAGGQTWQMRFGQNFEQVVAGSQLADSEQEAAFVCDCRDYIRAKGCTESNPSTYNVNIGGGCIVRTRPDFASADGLTAIDLKVTGSYDPEQPYSAWSAQYAAYKLAGVHDASFLIAHRTGTRPELYRVTSVSVEPDPAVGAAHDDLRQRLREQVADLFDTCLRLGISAKVFKPYSEGDIWSRR